MTTSIARLRGTIIDGASTEMSQRNAVHSSALTITQRATTHVTRDGFATYQQAWNWLIKFLDDGGQSAD